jgi:hypothetical protein
VVRHASFCREVLRHKVSPGRLSDHDHYGSFIIMRLAQLPTVQRDAPEVWTQDSSGIGLGSHVVAQSVVVSPRRKPQRAKAMSADLRSK